MSRRRRHHVAEINLQGLHGLAPRYVSTLLGEKIASARQGTIATHTHTRLLDAFPVAEVDSGRHQLHVILIGLVLDLRPQAGRLCRRQLGLIPPC